MPFMAVFQPYLIGIFRAVKAMRHAGWGVPLSAGSSVASTRSQRLASAALIVVNRFGREFEFPLVLVASWFYRLFRPIVRSGGFLIFGSLHHHFGQRFRLLFWELGDYVAAAVREDEAVVLVHEFVVVPVGGYPLD